MRRRGCREVAPEPLTVYEHPTGCMFYNPPLVLADQPIAAVANALKQLKVAEPDLVAKYLLPGLCRELWGCTFPSARRVADGGAGILKTRQASSEKTAVAVSKRRNCEPRAGGG